MGAAEVRRVQQPFFKRSISKTPSRANIHHRQFDYVGVIFNFDPTFQGTDEWYEHVARSRTQKDKQWYHVFNE